MMIMIIIIIISQQMDQGNLETRNKEREHLN